MSHRQFAIHRGLRGEPVYETIMDSAIENTQADDGIVKYNKYGEDEDEITLKRDLIEGGEIMTFHWVYLASSNCANRCLMVGAFITERGLSMYRECPIFSQDDYMIVARNFY